MFEFLFWVLLPRGYWDAHCWARFYTYLVHRTFLTYFSWTRFCVSPPHTPRSASSYLSHVRFTLHCILPARTCHYATITTAAFGSLPAYLYYVLWVAFLLTPFVSSTVHGWLVRRSLLLHTTHTTYPLSGDVLYLSRSTFFILQFLPFHTAHFVLLHLRSPIPFLNPRSTCHFFCTYWLIFHAFCSPLPQTCAFCGFVPAT